MAGNEKSAQELSSEELDAVTGGAVPEVKGGGQSDPAQQFQQILQQLSQGQG